MNIEMKVSGLDGASRAGLFPGLAFRSLAMRHGGLGRAFRKGPFAAAVGVDEQKLDRGSARAVADGSDLNRQSKSGNSGRTHARNLRRRYPTATIFQQC